MIDMGNNAEISDVFHIITLLIPDGLSRPVITLERSAGPRQQVSGYAVSDKFKVGYIGGTTKVVVHPIGAVPTASLVRQK